MSTPRLPGTVRVLLALAVFDVVLRTRGLEAALRLARRSNGRPTLAAWRAAWTVDVAHRVALGAAFYPRRALCLEQSLALYAMLRRAGAPATLRIGARPVPFAAHAWVEIDGEPVSEPPDFIAQLVPFPGLGG
jgi:hypothetical protein